MAALHPELASAVDDVLKSVVRLTNLLDEHPGQLAALKKTIGENLKLGLKMKLAKLFL